MSDKRDWKYAAGDVQPADVKRVLEKIAGVLKEDKPKAKPTFEMVFAELLQDNAVSANSRVGICTLAAMHYVEIDNVVACVDELTSTLKDAVRDEDASLRVQAKAYSAIMMKVIGPLMPNLSDRFAFLDKVAFPEVVDVAFPMCMGVRDIGDTDALSDAIRAYLYERQSLFNSYGRNQESETPENN